MNTPLSAVFSKTYPDVDPIQGDFAPSPAMITVLYGPSGCGKSTLLRCLAGLERPTTGTIRFAGQVWFDASSRVSMPPQQRGIGFLFQDYALFPHMTVGENIGYALTLLPERERRHRVSELLERFRLAGLENHLPDQISGGQQQRVALARVLAADPRLLLLDEPLSAVDAATRDTLRSELRAMLHQVAKPTVVVTHDWHEVQVLADEVILMDRGMPLQRGTASALYDRPRTVTAARIVGVDTLLPARFLGMEGADAVLEVSGVTLRVPAGTPPREPVTVGIRAEDVVLEKGPHPASGLPGVKGRIESLQPWGRNDRMRVDCGFPLLATMPGHERVARGLAVGDVVRVALRPDSVLLLSDALPRSP